MNGFIGILPILLLALNLSGINTHNCPAASNVVETHPLQDLLSKDKPVTCNNTAYPPPANTSLPWYTIDLATPADQRWRPLVSEYKTELNLMFTQLLDLLSLIDVDHWLVKLIDREGASLLESFPAEYRNEINSIADEAGADVGKVVLFNVFYEVFSVCTSIVAETSSGRQMHLRNLDFGLFMGWDFHNSTWEMSETLRKMVVNVRVERDGRPVYNHTSIVGFIGVLTGVRKGLSLSINEQFISDGGYVGIIEWLSGDHDQSWTTWLARQVLEDDTLSFTDAVHTLQKTRLVSPVYYIVAGDKPAEGAVITRSRASADDTYPLAPRDQARWYVLETNYDRWKSPFFLDNRRKPAHQCMDQSTQSNVTVGSIYNVLSTSPVLNRLTIYTAIMDPSTGELSTFLQNCPTCYYF